MIAIIAILAAILFPVFAQAKAAAKATAALSNTKQLDLSNIMYESDFDDYFPLGTAWNTGNDPICFGAGFCFSTWAVATSPYTKSVALLSDPSGPPNTQVASSVLKATPNSWATFSTGFGYNYEFLSPVLPTVNGVSATSAAAPADTVMLASKWVHNEDQNANQIWGVGPFPGGMLSDAAAEGVECGSLAQNCFTDWGRGGGYDNPGSIDITVETAGEYTGGNSFRVSGQVAVAWVDGHAKRISYSQLATGTNYNYNATSGSPGGNGAITITSGSKYLWSITKDCSQFIYGPCTP